MAIQANPNSIKQAGPDLSDTIQRFLFAVVAWHIPHCNISPALLNGAYHFINFPPEYADLHQKMGQFLHQLKESVGAEEWNGVGNHLPVNVRRLLREQYHL